MFVRWFMESYNVRRTRIATMNVLLFTLSPSDEERDQR
jgi:hypothetical protein